MCRSGFLTFGVKRFNIAGLSNQRNEVQIQAVILRMLPFDTTKADKEALYDEKREADEELKDHDQILQGIGPEDSVPPLMERSVLANAVENIVACIHDALHFV